MNEYETVTVHFQWDCDPRVCSIVERFYSHDVAAGVEESVIIRKADYEQLLEAARSMETSKAAIVNIKKY